MHSQWEDKNSLMKSIGCREGSFAVCFHAVGKLFIFPLFEQYKEATYLLQFLDLVHGGCQYCLESSKGMWESQIPRLVPSFSAPYMTFRNAMAPSNAQIICLRNRALLSLSQGKMGP